MRRHERSPLDADDPADSADPGPGPALDGDGDGDADERDSAGHTRGWRFAGLFISALAACGVMVGAVLQGALPVSAALRGRTDIKLSIRQVSTNADGSFPRFFQTRSGDRRAVVAIGLRDTLAQGVCASGRVGTPLGPHTLRITTRPGAELRLSDLQLALESVDGVQLAGGGLALNHATTTAGGVPVQTGPDGTLPINATDLRLRIHGNVRWVTASGLTLSGLDMGMGRHVKECF